MEIFILWIVLCIVPAVIAGAKGRSGIGIFFLSLFLSPLIGIIVALVMEKNIQGVEEKELGKGLMKKCPFCAELVKKEAIVCRHCGKDLPEEKQDKYTTDVFGNKIADGVRK